MVSATLLGPLAKHVLLLSALLVLSLSLSVCAVTQDSSSRKYNYADSSSSRPFSPETHESPSSSVLSPPSLSPTATGAAFSEPLSRVHNRLHERHLNGCVFLSVLYSDDFLPGVRVLGWSLTQTGSRLPRHILVTPEVSEQVRRTLINDGWQIQLVDSIQNPHLHEKGAQKRLNNVFTKLNIWGLSQFRRIIYLDGDTFVTENIDELCRCDARVSAVVRDVYFNAGVMVLTPDREVMHTLLNASSSSPSYNSGEQGFLNYMIPEFLRCPFFQPETDSLPPFLPEFELEPLNQWASLPGHSVHPLVELNMRRCLRLPPYYNGDIGMFTLRGNSWWIDPRLEHHRPKILHFTLGTSKPWFWYAYAMVTVCWEWYAGYQEVYSSYIAKMWIVSFLVLVPIVLFWLFAIRYIKPISRESHIKRFRIFLVILGFGVCLYASNLVSSMVPFFSPYGGYIIAAAVFASLSEALVICQLFPSGKSRVQLRVVFYPMLLTLPFVAFGIRPVGSKILFLVISFLFFATTALLYPMCFKFATLRNRQNPERRLGAP